MTMGQLIWRIVWWICFISIANELRVFVSVIGTERITRRRLARVDGDIVLGALFPVHRAPSQKTSYTRTCGEIWEQYGMHRIEMFFMVIDDINNNPKILPNITLGYDVRDSCWYAPVATEQSIDFIKDSIASLEEKSSRANRTTLEECTRKHNKPIAGLIGPGSSSSSIQVQHLLQIFNIPQIGYSATSIELSDKSMYKYFLRVVPSDVYQAQSMVDILLLYNWTYISTVYSEGSYGAGGIEKFESRAKENGICIANNKKIMGSADNGTFDLVVKQLMETPRARVVVCFCEGRTATGLFKATVRLDTAGHFLIVGSDGWADRPDVVQDVRDAAAGGISMKLHSAPLRNFDKHFLSLRPSTNHRNPWFREFWQEKYSCYLEGHDRDVRFSTKCTGHEQNNDYTQDSKLGFVVNGVYSMAFALHNMHRVVCGGSPGLCEAMQPIEGSTYLRYLLNVSFTSYSGDKVHFDANGDPPGRYDIMNFQKWVDVEGNATYGYVRVGTWDNGMLTMNDSDIYWPSQGKGGTITSVCSEPCGMGYVKQVQTGGVACCWLCIRCSDNSIVVGETCQECSRGWWPDEPLTACHRIVTDHMDWDDTEAIVAITMACVGILTTLWLFLVFVTHNDTPVVKASTRELSYIIMLGIIIAFSCNFVLVAKPTIVTCYFSRIFPGLSFSLIYGALVTKTNRIARILEGSKKIMTKKPRFMSASAQVVITCIVIGIECAIITIMLIKEPADSKLDYPSPKRVRLICNTSTYGIIVPLGFDLVLIFMCTLYAIKTRNLPENFNEAKFIGFTMYTTCIIWLGFLPIYFESESKVITLCIAISLSASVALVLLFFPKVYIIIWAPEKNTRSAFTTSKDVRCHIGSQLGTGRNTTSSDHFEALRPLCRRVVLRQRHNRIAENSDSEDEFKEKVIIRDSNFQEVAFAMFRQKNFFDRWKERGSMRAGSGGRNNVRWNRTPHPNLYPVSSQNSIQVSSGNGDQSENHKDSPSKDSKSNSSRLIRRSGRQSRKEEPDVKDLSTISSHDESSPRSDISQRYHIQSVDSSTQTDDQLLRLFLSDIQNDSRQYDSQSNVDGMSQWDYFLLTRNAGKLKDNMKNENNTQSGVHRRPIHIKLQNEDHIYDSCLDITFHNNTSEMSPLLANDHQEASFSDEMLVDHEPSNEYFDDLHEFEIRGDPPPQISNLYNGTSEIMVPANTSQVNGNGASPMSRFKHRKISEPNNFLCFPESAYRKNLDPGNISLRTHSDECILRDKVTKLEINGPSSVGNVNLQDTKRDMFVFEKSDLDVSTISRRPSAFSKSSSSAKASPTKNSMILSLEEMSLHGLDALEEEETTLENFRLFLRTKGVNLDLSAVQSSDV